MFESGVMLADKDRRKIGYQRHKDDAKESDELRLLSRVVCMMNSREPKTGSQRALHEQDLFTYLFICNSISSAVITRHTSS